MGRYIGTDGDDFLGPIGPIAVDFFDGRGGDDAITMDYGLDTALGGTGDDRFDTTRGNQQLKVGFYSRGDWREFDFLPSSESIDGGEGDDYVLGSAGTDTIHGGEGFDLVSFERGTFWSDGVLYGAYWRVTSTTARYDRDAGILVDLGRGVASFDGYDYTLTMTAERETYVARRPTYGAFEHVLTGVEAAVGMIGDDTLIGSSGDNLLDGGPAGSDLLDGAGGFDIASFARRAPVFVANGVREETRNLVADLRLGTATFDIVIDDVKVRGGEVTLRRIEGLFGTGYNDVLYGDSRNNLFFGGDGADTINGFQGVDTVTYSRDPILTRHLDFMPTGAGGVVVNLASGLAVDGFGRRDVLKNIENVVGSTAGDRIIGDKQNNVLEGREGDDQIAGGAGDDVVSGGQGRDTLSGGAGNDVLTYADEQGGRGVVLDFPVNQDLSYDTYGDEDVFSSSSFETVVGSIYDDSIVGASGEGVTQFGLAGNDTLTGGRDLNGGSGDDRLEGRGSGLLDGGTGDDLLIGNIGRSTLEGGDGDDTLQGAAQDDKRNGADEDDILRGGAGDDMLTDLWSQFGQAGVAFEKWEEARLANRAMNTRDLNILKGEAGNDTLVGVGLLQGGDGDDSISGGGVLDGGAGDDVIRSDRHGLKYAQFDAILSGNLGADTLIDGGGLNVFASYDYARQGVVVNLTTGVARAGRGDVDTLVDIRGIIGSDHADRVVSAGRNVSVDGGLGNDVVSVTDGDGYLLGRDGADKLTILQGSGNLFGGEGNDTLSASGAGASLYGEAGHDRITLNLDHARFVWGGAGDDTITGTLRDVPSNAGERTEITGAAGDDVIDVTVKQRALIDGGEDHDRITVKITGGGTGAQAEGIEVQAGSGNDAVVIRQTRAAAPAIDVDLGTGNDTLTSYLSGLRVDSGTGDDTLIFDYDKAVRGDVFDVALGAGKKTVVIKHLFDTMSVLGFDSGDRFDISAINDRNSDTFPELLKLAEQTEFGAEITVKGMTMRFIGYEVGDLTAGMFIL